MSINKGFQLAGHSSPFRSPPISGESYSLRRGYRNLNLPAPPPPTPDLSVIKRHVSPKIASVTRNKMEDVKANDRISHGNQEEEETKQWEDGEETEKLGVKETQRRSAVEGGREGEGERSGGEEIGGSLRGLQEVDDGNDSGEADVPSGGIGAAVAVLSFVEFQGISWNHCAGLHRDLGSFVL
ncbi:hypothetical protein F3Y22_tig00003725pilonHSYRG00139 [Hibiscus syriacus]|uniref:Uncharacterized protein n=1 Tax=Hibiscus syriacus TaxID=106335 RepID=A0A6A3CNN0_HIBSY|nr:hypothetical protein F3Y22_tig00003725pilonHSYRG00139 [Hibiscus syriacus]